MEGLLVLLVLAACCGLPVLLLGGAGMLKRGAALLNHNPEQVPPIQADRERQRLDGTRAPVLPKEPDRAEHDGNPERPGSP